MADQSQSEQLLAQFAQTGEAVRDFAASRTPEQRQERGTEDAWSAGDMLALVAFWMDYTVDRMGYHTRGETPPQGVDFGAIQEQARQAASGDSWETLTTNADRALASLMGAVRESPDVLQAYNSYGEEPGGPFFGEIQANGFIWPLQELEKYLRRVGEDERADRIRATLAAVVGMPETVVCELVEPMKLGSWLRDGVDGDGVQGTPLVIDVRDEADYARGHIAGAEHIPLAKLADRMENLPTARPIVTYCNMHHPGESRGERAAALLTRHGFNAMAINGGFPAWEASGQPVEATSEQGRE